MKKPDLRLPALRRFAAAITVLTVLGHGFLGFEQSYAHVFVALLTAYVFEISLEWIDAKATQRAPRFSLRAPMSLINFLLPAHIGALAIAMLLYSNEQLMPVVFAVCVALGSKYVFRVRTEKGEKHFFNPSNTGIAVTLMLFPWVGIAPPYQFSENISGALDWLLPAFLLIVGTLLNAKFTKRLPVILAWVAVFVLQAVLRSWLFDTALIPALAPMTGIAFLLFTFYMVSDPGTTPYPLKGQILFGASVALVYGLLMTLHVVFGLFFALFTVCAVRGMLLYLQAHQQAQAQAQADCRLAVETVS